MGYYRAGWDVVGVDIKPQPHYPFMFVQDDALHFLRRNFSLFDAVHASPPCQAFSTLNNGRWGNSTGHPDLIEPTRQALVEIGLPYIIENVVGSPLVDPIRLCGSSFDLRIVVEEKEFELRRHRLFESNVRLEGRPCDHRSATMGVYGHGRGGGPLRGRSANKAQAAEIMGIDWCGRDGIAQAIPPAYTEYLGRQLETAA